MQGGQAEGSIYPLPPRSVSTEEEQQVLNNIAISVDGYLNQFDCDGLAGIVGVEDTTSIASMGSSQNIQMDWSNCTPSMLKTPIHPTLIAPPLAYAAPATVSSSLPPSVVPSLVPSAPATVTPSIAATPSTEATWQRRSRPSVARRSCKSSVTGKF